MGGSVFVCVFEYKYMNKYTLSNFFLKIDFYLTLKMSRFYYFL